MELKEFSAFLNLKNQLFQDENIEYIKRTTLAVIETHFALVAQKENGQRVGAILAYVIPHLFNPKLRVLSETVWWVSEEHRRSRAAVMLLDAFVEYGREHCDWLVFALESVTPVNERCLLKRGFRPHEKSYLLEIAR